MPTELLDGVCGFVEQPSDLLSFALTCKRACRVIIPNHIELRHIRCDLLRESLWNKLADFPALASRITSLDIIDESRTTNVIVPAHAAQFTDALALSPMPLSHFPNTPADFASKTQALSRAIKSMVNLTRFAWQAMNVLATGQVFASLNNCERLDDVRVLYGVGLHHVLASTDIGPSPLWNFSNLRRFSFSTGSGVLPSTFHLSYHTRMCDMLTQRCPNLEDLHVPQSYGIASLLSHGSWPHLKRLSIGYGDTLWTNNDLDIQRFLNVRRTLERLCIPVQHPAAWSVTGLPNLKALDVGMYRDLSSVVPDIMVGERLEFLSCINFTSSSLCSCPGGSLAFLNRVPNLRVMQVFCSKPSNQLLVSIAEAVPRLERLHFERWTFLTAITTKSVECGTFAKRIKFVSRLPCLTHLSQFIALNLDSEPNDTDLIGLVMEQFANVSKSLEFVEIRWTSKAKWVTILRDEDAYKGWCYTTAKDLGNVRARGWGKLFFGIEGIAEEQWSS